MGILLGFLIIVWILLLIFCWLSKYLEKTVIRLLAAALCFILLSFISIVALVLATIWGMHLSRVLSSGSYKAKKVYTDGQAIGNTCYRIYKGKVYAVSKSGSEFIYYKARELDVNPSEFKVYRGLYCVGHNENSVFVAHIKLPGADPDTFRSVQVNMFNQIFADKSRLYRVEGYPDEVNDVSDITILDEDPTSIRVLEDFGYLVGNNNVYYQGELLEGIEPHSVRIPAWGVGVDLGLLGSGIPFAYDIKNNTAYCKAQRIYIDINNIKGYKVMSKDSNAYYVIGDGSKFYTKLCYVYTLEQLQRDGVLIPLSH